MEKVLETEESAKQRARTRKVATAAGLAVLCVAGHKAEDKGIMHDWPDWVEGTGTSVKHLLPGYVGAWLAINRLKHRPAVVKFFGTLDGAFIMNEVAEKAQDIWIGSDSRVSGLTLTDFGNQKDLAFALAIGAGGYMLQNRDEFRSQPRLLPVETVQQTE